MEKNSRKAVRRFENKEVLDIARLFILHCQMKQFVIIRSDYPEH